MKLEPINCKTATISELKKAFYNRQPISGIEKRVSHYGPHNDELLPMFLMEETKEGKRVFPNIENTAIGHVTPTWLRQNEMLGEYGFFKALQKGILLFGIGGGPFDEHNDKEKLKSCVNLIIDYLDLYRNPDNREIYGGLISYVTFEDMNGDNIIKVLNSKNPDHLLNSEETKAMKLLSTGSKAQNLKRGFESAINDKEYAEVIYGAFQFFKNHVRQAKLFLEAKKVFNTIPQKTLEIKVIDQKMFLWEIESDHRVIHKVAHLKWPANKKEKMAVLFVKRTNGQFMLMPNRKFVSPEQMREVVKIIRQMITKNSGEQRLHFLDMGKNQTIDLVPEIHFDETTGIISNGSPIDFEVQGMIGDVLSSEEIVRAIRIGLDTEYYPKDVIKQCLKGKCSKGACPIYQYGQERCHTIRSKEKGTLGVIIEKSLEKKTA